LYLKKPSRARHWTHWAGCIAATLFAFLVLDGPTVRAEPAPESPPREWTVMIYMNGKNNLEPDALNNFHAISSIGSTDKVALVVELGRPKKPTKADGNWSGVYRFLVGRDQSPRPKSAVEKVASGTPSDMGRRETLSDFIKWSKSKYPAKHYMLVVWNHGQGYRLTLAMLATKMNVKPLRTDGVPTPGLGAVGGFRAISSDDDTGSVMYNAEVEQAIVENFGASKLDLVGFDLPHVDDRDRLCLEIFDRPYGSQ
jgi:Clostripain family